MDVKAWKQKLEGCELEEFCPGIQCDACGSAYLVQVVRVRRRSVTCFYAVCFHCLAVKFGIAW
jgi:hypothetical protein